MSCCQLVLRVTLMDLEDCCLNTNDALYLVRREV